MRVPRYLEAPVRAALAKKMVFVGGPRQVGETTFALGVLGADADERHPAYLNWDHPAVPPRLRNAQLPPKEPLLLFDEIHKYARWRSLPKGIYDTERSHRRIIGTGAARIVDWCCLPEDELISAETQKHMDQAIQGLPPNLRVVFVLRDIQGLSTQEVSEVLNLSETR